MTHLKPLFLYHHDSEYPETDGGAGPVPGGGRGGEARQQNHPHSGQRAPGGPHTTLQCSDGAKTTSPQILAACSIHFCSSFPGLTVTVGMFSLTCLLVMVPSYSLLSEICLIRYR